MNNVCIKTTTVCMLLLVLVFTCLPSAQVLAAPKKCTVTFKPSGGKITKAKAKKVVKVGAKLGKLPKVARAGYTFKGWYSKKAGGTKIKATTKIKTNKTFYAHFKAGKGKKPTAKGMRNGDIKDGWVWVGGHYEEKKVVLKEMGPLPVKVDAYRFDFSTLGTDITGEGWIAPNLYRDPGWNVARVYFALRYWDEASIRQLEKSRMPGSYDTIYYEDGKKKIAEITKVEMYKDLLWFDNTAPDDSQFGWDSVDRWLISRGWGEHGSFGNAYTFAANIWDTEYELVSTWVKGHWR